MDAPTPRIFTPARIVALALIAIMGLGVVAMFVPINALPSLAAGR